MSLIDQALRRAQAAQQDGAASLTARPWAPTPLPDRHRRRRRQTEWALCAILLLGTLVTIAFLLSRAPGKNRNRVAGASARTVPLNPGAARGIAPAIPSPTIMSEVFVNPPPRRPETSRQWQASSPAVGEPAVSVASAHDAGTPVSSDKNAQPPAEARSAAAISDVRTYAGEVSLPGGERIELGGIVFSETNPVALINGRVIGGGGGVEGFTLTEIQPDRVKLQRGDTTIWIRLK
jgi:hypothetical protein